MNPFIIICFSLGHLMGFAAAVSGWKVLRCVVHSISFAQFNYCFVTEYAILCIEMKDVMFAPPAHQVLSFTPPAANLPWQHMGENSGDM